MKTIMLSGNRTARLIQDDGVRVDSYDADGRTVGFICFQASDVDKLQRLREGADHSHDLKAELRKLHEVASGSRLYSDGHRKRVEAILNA